MNHYQATVTVHRFLRAGTVDDALSVGHLGVHIDTEHLSAATSVSKVAIARTDAREYRHAGAGPGLWQAEVTVTADIATPDMSAAREAAFQLLTVEASPSDVFEPEMRVALSEQLRAA